MRKGDRSNFGSLSGLFDSIFNMNLKCGSIDHLMKKGMILFMSESLIIFFRHTLVTSAKKHFKSRHFHVVQIYLAVIFLKFN